MSLDWRERSGVHIVGGDGQRASRAFFKRGQSVFQGFLLHDNVRFYKYCWSIWTEEDLAGDDLPTSLDDLPISRDEPLVPSLCTHDAVERAVALYRDRRVFLIRNGRLKRIGPDTPWNMALVPLHERAPRYDDDQDPEYFGHR